MFALADALAAVRAGRGDAATAALLLKLVPDLLTPAQPVRAQPEQIAIRVEPAPTLHALSRAIEAQLFTRAYRDAGGDFEAIARRYDRGRTAAAPPAKVKVPAITVAGVGLARSVLFPFAEVRNAEPE